MALKKRKTPLTELFPEREALRVKPISNKSLTNNKNRYENNRSQSRKQN